MYAYIIFFLVTELSEMVRTYIIFLVFFFSVFLFVSTSSSFEMEWLLF